MANSTSDSRITPQDAPVRGPNAMRERREPADAATQPARPARRRRANEITSAIGLTPITGLSGPKIAY